MSYETLIRVAPETSVERLDDPRRDGRVLFDTSGMRLMPDGRTIPLLENHDPTRVIGKVTELMRLRDVDGWWLCAVAELETPPAWVKRGAPASFRYHPLREDTFGHGIVRSGIVSEVSVLNGLEPAEPMARVLYVKPKVEKPTPAVIRRSPAPVAQRISKHSETEELKRRMDWLGPNVSVETILEHMNIELGYERRW